VGKADILLRQGYGGQAAENRWELTGTRVNAENVAMLAVGWQASLAGQLATSVRQVGRCRRLD
jgi:hypothetical protein